MITYTLMRLSVAQNRRSFIIPYFAEKKKWILFFYQKQNPLSGQHCCQDFRKYPKNRYGMMVFKNPGIFR